MTLKEEFEFYHNKLLEKDRVKHIKENINNCNLCKQVANTHSMCVSFNETGSATFFIESMKDYLKFYGE